MTPVEAAITATAAVLVSKTIVEPVSQNLKITIGISFLILFRSTDVKMNFHFHLPLYLYIYIYLGCHHCNLKASVGFYVTACGKIYVEYVCFFTVFLGGELP